MRISYSTLYVIHFIVIIICFGMYFLLVNDRHTKTNKKVNILALIIFAILEAIVMSVPQLILKNEPFTYFSLFISQFIILRISFGSQLDDTLNMALCSTFHLVAIKGITTGCASLILGKNMYQILLVQNWAIVVDIATVVLATIIFLFYYLIKNDDIKALENAPGPKHRLITMEVALTLFLLFYSYNYYYNVEIVWFSVAQILTSIIMIVMYILLTYSTSRMAALVQQDLKSKIEDDKIKKQMAQLTLRRQSVQKISDFKHHYNELIMSLDYLCENGTIEQIKNYLKENEAMVSNSIPEITKFSNNEIIDSMLYETSGVCKTSDIAFKALVYVPDNTRMPVEEITSNLSKLIDNAIEANSKVKDKTKRFLHIETTHNANWLTIKIINPYSGRLKVVNNQIHINEEDIEFKGSGLAKVKNSVEKYSGMINLEANKEEHIFSVSLHIYVPETANKDAI